MTRRLLGWLLCTLAWAAAPRPGVAQAPTAAPVKPAETATPAEQRRLADLFRGLLLQNLPEPLAAHEDKWGQQRDMVVGVKWHGLKATPQHALRNDGNWQRLTVTAINPAETLAVGIHDLATPEPGRTTFDAYIGLDVRATHEQQLWKGGVRLTSFETRGRCRLALRAKCEVTSRVEKVAGSLLPVAVLRVRVVEAELNEADLVCEHIARLDGRAAQVAGDALRKFVKQVKPNLERDLNAKANAAIVKAADTKDVRLELAKLLGK